MENDSVAFANQLLEHLEEHTECKPEVVVKALVDYLFEKNIKSLSNIK